MKIPVAVQTVFCMGVWVRVCVSTRERERFFVCVCACWCKLSMAIGREQSTFSLNNDGKEGIPFNFAGDGLSCKLAGQDNQESRQQVFLHKLFEMVWLIKKCFV